MSEPRNDWARTLQDAIAAAESTVVRERMEWVQRTFDVRGRATRLDGFEERVEPLQREVAEASARLRKAQDRLDDLEAEERYLAETDEALKNQGARAAALQARLRKHDQFRPLRDAVHAAQERLDKARAALERAQAGNASSRAGAELIAATLRCISR